MVAAGSQRTEEGLELAEAGLEVAEAGKKLIEDKLAGVVVIELGQHMCLPMPEQAGKLSLERNGGYTCPKGLFHPAEGHGGQLSSLCLQCCTLYNLTGFFSLA